MNNNILLSIIIPIYKVEKFINKCIDSIINQYIDGIEILLIDDGSPDNCGKIIDEYALKYKYIKAYHKENGGLSDARNYGIDKALGEYIWFIDSDDYIKNDCISKLIMNIKYANTDVFVIQSKIIKDEKIFDERNYTIKSKKYTSKEYMYQLKAHPEAIIFCAQYEIVKRKLLIENNIYFLKGILHEDELWTPQVLICAQTIYYSGMNIYFHVMRSGSIMNSKNYERSGNSDIIVVQELLKIFENSKRDDLIYMRDNIANIYLQSVWKIPNFIEIKNINRFLPIKNAYYIKTRLKAILFALSPKLYLIIHRYKKS